MRTHGDSDRPVTKLQHLLGKALSLAADGQSTPAVIHRPHIHRVLPQCCAVQRQPAATEQLPQLFRCTGPYREAEYRAHGSPDGLGIIEIRTARQKKYAVCLEGIRRAENGPDISGVLYAVQHHIPPPVQNFRKSALRYPAHRQCSLRSLRW